MKQTTPLLFASCVIMQVCSPSAQAVSSSEPLHVAHSVYAEKQHTDSLSVDELMASLEMDDADLAEERRWVADTFYQKDAISLRVLRLKAGLSQAQLAQIIDSQQSYIAKLEGGANPDVRLTTLSKLADALHVTLDEIGKALGNGKPS